MGNCSKNGMTSSGETVFWPLGLLTSLATLAINLFTDIPADAVSPTSLRIRNRISSAISEALGFPFLLWVTSR